MSISPSPSSKMAMILLGLIGLSLLVGIFNAVNSQFIKSDLDVKNEKEDSFLSVIASTGKKDHLMLVELSGPIMMDPPQQGGLFSEDSAAVTARKALDWAAKDSSVKGVLLRINSPGGTVGMSQELNAAVKRVSKEKPVVASLGDMAASGGYYTACAADKIVSNPGTLTASIGVIINGMNLKGLLVDKLGLKPTTIKSGKFKDILSPYRDAAPEEIALIQRMVNESYEDFVGAVIEGRTRFISDEAAKKELAAKIRSVADGRVVSGAEGVKVGLVDMIGDIYAARKELDKMAKERFNLKDKEELPLKEYSESGGLLQALGLTSTVDRILPKAQTPSWESMLPMSATHPNQLLWVLE